MSAPFRRIASVTVVCWLAAHGTPALGVLTSWNTNSNGNFDTPANWTLGVPGSVDTAIFDRGANVNYTVTLNGAPFQLSPVVHTIDRLIVNANTVSLVRNPLLGATSLVANDSNTTALDQSIEIGTTAATATLSTTIPVSAQNATIGDAANSVGTWNVIGSSVTLNSLSLPLTVGNNGSGTLNISAGGSVSVPNFTSTGVVLGKAREAVGRCWWTAWVLSLTPQMLKS